VRVLSDHQIPALPKCTDPGPQPSQNAVFGTDGQVAAGIRYATDLKRAGYSPMVINMSLGGSELAQIEKDAIDYAIANGVIVVAAAGNDGEAGMGFPGAYAPVISAGAIGWTGEWLKPTDHLPRYRMWWLKDGDHVPPLLPGNWRGCRSHCRIGHLRDGLQQSRAAGTATRCAGAGLVGAWPVPGDPGFNHLPWWSNGIGDIKGGHNSGNFFYVGGTSMATPHTSALAALMLQKNPSLTLGTGREHHEVDGAAAGDLRLARDLRFRSIRDDHVGHGLRRHACNAVGAGVIQADAALNATP
jgi:subtilisin family serine protease